MSKRNIFISVLAVLGIAIVVFLCLLVFKYFKPKPEEQAITASVSCSDPEVVKKVRSDLANTIQKQVGLNIQTNILDDGDTYNEEALKAVFSAMKVKASNSRVQDQQSSTGTLTCATTIAVVLPAPIYEEADQVAELEPTDYEQCEVDCGSGQRNTQRAADSSLDFDGTKVSQASLTYVLQKDTDGKLLVQIEDFGPIKSFVTDAIVNAMDLPNALRRDAESQSSNAEYQAKMQQKLDLITQSMDIRLKEVTAEYDTINNELNSIWQKAGAATTQLILAEQRDWLKKRDIDCEIESDRNTVKEAEKQTYDSHRESWTNDMDAKDKEIRRVMCINRVTKERIPPLSAKITGIQENKQS